jgi:hypothetical protein
MNILIRNFFRRAAAKVEFAEIEETRKRSLAAAFPMVVPR